MERFEINYLEDMSWINMGVVGEKESPKQWAVDNHYLNYDYAREIFKVISPSNYMEPYNSQSVEQAKELYTQFLSIRGGNKEDLRTIRKRSAEILGVKYDAKPFYLWLMHKYSPKQYLEPYNEQKFQELHEISTRLSYNKDNFDVLEDIWLEQIKKEEEYNKEVQERQEQLKLQDIPKSQKNKIEKVLDIGQIILLIIPISS